MLRGPDWTKTGRYDTEYHEIFKEEVTAKIRGLFFSWPMTRSFHPYDVKRPTGILRDCDWLTSQDALLSVHLELHWKDARGIIESYFDGWPLKE